MARRGALVRSSGERHQRSRPFEIFTRPQRSLPARVLGLMIRLRAELLVALVALLGWVWLSERMPAWVVALLAGLVLLVAALWPRSRRYVVRRGFAVMTRHRLRAVFVERRIMNYSGNVPVLLWCRPTPVGERVWVLLRAGIDAGDIERALAHVASTCWAADARLIAHRKVTALVLLDVVRRDPLTGRPVSSSLPDFASMRLHVVPDPRRDCSA